MTWTKRVTLLDGPAAGQPCEYLTPLPEILVVATKNGRVAWHDYRRVPGTTSYRYVTRAANVTPPASPSAYPDEHEIDGDRTGWQPPAGRDSGRGG